MGYWVGGGLRETLECAIFGDFGTNEVWVTKHANDATMGVSRKKKKGILEEVTA